MLSKNSIDLLSDFRVTVAFFQERVYPSLLP